MALPQLLANVSVNSLWLNPPPNFSISFTNRAGSSLIPFFLANVLQTAAISPAAITELPPSIGIFSITTTCLHPFCFAEIAAQVPAIPEPTTTTSKLSSQATGSEG